MTGPDLRLRRDTSLSRRPERGREFRIRSHRTAQRVAAVLAVVIAVALAVWVWKTSSWLELCDEVDALGGLCSQPPSGLRIALFIVSLVGAAVGGVVVVYLARFARRGGMWRHSTALAAAFCVTTMAWIVLYIVARSLV